MILATLLRKVINPLGIDLVRFYNPTPIYRQYIDLANELEIDLILDVGANQGQYASAMIQHGWNKTICSFEPLSRAHQMLSDKAQSVKNWKVMEKMAIGDANGYTEINVSANSYSSSILPIRKEVTDVLNEASYVAKEVVIVKTLDSISEEIEEAKNIFLKIDTQGFEHHVINGGLELIKNKVRIIQLEISLVPLYDGAYTIDQILPLMASLGFKPKYYFNEFSDVKTSQLLQIEGLFVKNGI